MGFFDSGFGGVVGGIGGLIGADMARSSSNKRADKDFRRQKYFAQNSLLWTIDQARKKGVSPLVALGNVPQYSPATYMDSRAPGDALMKMGQGAGDLIAGKLSKKEKLIQEIQVLQEHERLKQMRLETQGMRKQYEDSQSKPSVPTHGESSFLAGQDVNLTPANRVAEDKTSPGTEPGQSMRYQWVKSPGGRWYAVTTKELAEVLESDTSAWTKFMIEELSRFTQGLIKGNPGMKPPESLLGKRKRWKYHRLGYWYQEPFVHKKAVGKAPWEKKKRFRFRYPSDIGM